MLHYLRWNTITHGSSTQSLFRHFKTESLNESLELATRAWHVVNQNHMEDDVSWLLTDEDLEIDLRIGGPSIAEQRYAIVRQIDEALDKPEPSESEDAGSLLQVWQAEKNKKTPPTDRARQEMSRLKAPATSLQQMRDRLMANGWRHAWADDERAILTKDFLVKDLTSAFAMVHDIVCIVINRAIADDIMLSFWHDKVHLVLHAFSKGSVPDDYYQAAEDIETKLRV